MIADSELQEYLVEIRRHVCRYCVERPPGGPPCQPVGKACGVEMHLPQLVESVRQVHSDLLDPYVQHNRREICEHCTFLHSAICPCPMDYLAGLLVEAVETVDERKRERGERRPTGPPPEPTPLEEVYRAYEAGTGTWTGCDWTTAFGKCRLDLNGVRADDAEDMAVEARATTQADDWAGAAEWLTHIEAAARLAENAAASAVAAAASGEWEQALRHAERAWALELGSGRPIWHGYPMAWQRLRQVVQAAYAAQSLLGSAVLDRR
jgi:hypothetical protein